MDPKLKQQYEDFLNPDVLRPRLVAASVFIACCEAMKESVTDRVRNFFGTDPRYITDVKKRKKDPAQPKNWGGLMFNTLGWLKEMGTLNDADIQAYDRVRTYRNALAHKLFSLLDSGLPPSYEVRFDEMVALLRKIDVWWIREMEFPEELEGKDIPDSEIMSGMVAGMHLIRDIALGDPDKNHSYLDAFRKLAGVRLPPIR